MHSFGTTQQLLAHVKPSEISIVNI